MVHLLVQLLCVLCYFQRRAEDVGVPHWGGCTDCGGCTVETLPDAIAVKFLMLHML